MMLHMRSEVEDGCVVVSAEYFRVSATMSSVQHLREFISERLTAAAEEIFTEFEKTIVQYEEEMDRQRRLLDITWKPQINLIRTELPQQHVYQEEEVLTDQQLCDQERNSSLDQGGFPEIKEEQEEVCTSQEGEQLVLKQETDYSLLVSTFQESYCSEAEPNTDQLSSHDSPLPENQDQEGNKDMDSTRDVEMKPEHRTDRNTSPSDDEDEAPISHIDPVIHLPSHTDEKPFICATCGKCFNTARKLLVHIRVHSREKMHSCKLCGKGFNQRGHLLRHMRTHTGERPFTCERCGKSFSQSCHLFNHMTTHTGEKPFTCGTCGKGFSRRGSLISHMRTHTGERPYTCETCGKKFSLGFHLFNHVRIHTGEKPFACGTCGKSFSRRDYLRIHLKAHIIKK